MQDASPEYHECNQVWVMASYVPLGVSAEQEACGAGGDHPTFLTAASGFTNSFPGTAGHTWKH